MKKITAYLLASVITVVGSGSFMIFSNYSQTHIDQSKTHGSNSLNHSSMNITYNINNYYTAEQNKK